MSLERKLVAAALLDRSAFDAVAASPEAEQFNDLLGLVFASVRGFYERDPDAARVDIDVLSAGLLSVALNPKRGRECAALAQELVAVEDVSPENVTHLLRAQSRERKGMALAAAIAGRRPEDEIRAALDEYEQTWVDATVVDEGPQWGDALRSRVDPSSRMKVSPKRLNESLGGGVCPGHNITIFGRPEAGKTALAITMACGFARRGHRVLYVGNEDPIQDIMVRCITNLTNSPLSDITVDPDRLERLALEKGASNMVMRSTAPGTIREIEALIKQHKPAVLFVDQLRNITSGKSDNYTQLLDRNAQAVRALGKRYGLVTVSVTQAGDSASGRAILTMGDVDSSNTGIPGAADVMIGVGVTDALDAAGQRMLAICKNKLGPHSQVLVNFDTFRSQMK